jgi:hypothetical protein
MGVGVCVGCGHKVNSAWAVCPECGADPTTGHAAHLNADAERVNFPRAHYLGGLRRFPQPLTGELLFTQAAIDIAGPQEARLLPMAEVERIELLNSLPAEATISGGARAGAAAVGTLALGPVGLAMALATTTPERFNRLTFAVHARAGEDAYEAVFAIGDLYPNRFRDRLTPLLEAVGVPLVEALPDPPSTTHEVELGQDEHA